MNSKKVRAIHFSGGKSGQYTGVQLEFFEKNNRWALTSLFSTDDIGARHREDSLIDWMKENPADFTVVNVNDSHPICETCTLSCPGEKSCPQEEVVDVRRKISEILQSDLEHEKKSPKEYERKREGQDSFPNNREIFFKDQLSIPLDKPFKRKLKNGYAPYWNRPIDFFVWSHFYTPLMKLFNYSFDSYGRSSLMLNYKFTYLKKRLGPSEQFLESNIYVVLLQLLKSKKISKKTLDGLRFDDEEFIDNKMKLIQELEKNLGIFIYEIDEDLLLTVPRAIMALLLGISGISKSLSKNLETPDPSYIIPSF